LAGVKNPASKAKVLRSDFLRSWIFALQPQFWVKTSVKNTLHAAISRSPLQHQHKQSAPLTLA